jgi:hypothetical protein
LSNLRYVDPSHRHETGHGDEGLVKVEIDLQSARVDADYPPTGTEILWAKIVDERHAEIDNIPFFTRDVSYGDIVAVRERHGGRREIDHVSHRGGHSTYRIVIYDNLSVEQSAAADRGLAALRALDCGFEQGGATFWAIDVPPTSDADAVRAALINGGESNIWDWEEGYIHRRSD